MSEVSDKFRMPEKKVVKPKIMIGSNSFVSSTILTSEDGMFGDKFKEEELEKKPGDETRDVGNGDMRPLYEQLADQKDRKQEEFDAIMNSHRMQAPPPLDEEDAKFINDKLDAQKEEEKKRKRYDDTLAADFQRAQATQAQAVVRQAPSIRIHSKTSAEEEEDEGAAGPLAKYIGASKKQAIAPKAVIKRIKKSDMKKKKKQKAPQAKADNKPKASATVKSSTPVQPTAALSSLLGGYGSSDSD